MTSLNKYNYPDLLGKNSDKLQEALIHDLNKVARRFDGVQMPEWKRATVANALRAHVLLKRVPASRRFQLATKRPVKRVHLVATIAVASLSFILLMGAALPNIVPLEQLLGWLDHTYGNHQVGKVVNLQQSSCGFTMTVKRVYANAAQMIVVYELDAPKNHNFIHGDFGPAQNTLSLSDDYGHTFPVSFANPTAVAFEGNDSSQFLNFDISELARIPASLSLHLNIPSLFALEIPGSLITSGCETINSEKGLVTSDPTVVAPAVQGTTIHTAFNFSFTVPVQAGAQVLRLNKTVTSNGTSIMLKRVVVTPAGGIFVYIKDGYGTIVTDLVVTVNGKEVSYGGAGTSGADGRPDGQILSFPNGLHGQWKLTYTSNPSMQGTDKFRHPIKGLNGIQAGPWVFTFSLP